MIVLWDHSFKSVYLKSVPLRLANRGYNIIWIKWAPGIKFRACNLACACEL